MKKIANLACILIAATTLAACSYFDTGEEVDVSSGQPTESIDLKTGAPIEQQELAPVEYKDVAHVIRESSDGRVQIFPLDGPEEWPTEDNYDQPQPQSYNDGSISVEPVPVVPLYSENYLNAYPGVEVFPLDDDMARIVNPRLVPPSNVPMTLTPLPGERDAGKDFVSLGIPGGAQTVVYFDHDSVMLKPEDTSMLNSLAKGYGGQDVSVAGHASVQSSIEDPVQRKIINLKISMDRAFAVARALIEGGIPPERIETKAFGETRPPVPGHKPIEVASRRVEISGITVQ